MRCGEQQTIFGGVNHEGGTDPSERSGRHSTATATLPDALCVERWDQSRRLQGESSLGAGDIQVEWRCEAANGGRTNNDEQRRREQQQRWSDRPPSLHDVKPMGSIWGAVGQVAHFLDPEGADRPLGTCRPCVSARLPTTLEAAHGWGDGRSPFPYILRVQRLTAFAPSSVSDVGGKEGR